MFTSPVCTSHMFTSPVYTSHISSVYTATLRQYSMGNQIRQAVVIATCTSSPNAVRSWSSLIQDPSTVTAWTHQIIHRTCSAEKDATSAQLPKMTFIAVHWCCNRRLLECYVSLLLGPCVWGVLEGRDFVIWVVANSCVTGLANSPYNTASLKHAIHGRTSNSSSTTSELFIIYLPQSSSSHVVKHEYCLLTELATVNITFLIGALLSHANNVLTMLIFYLSYAEHWLTNSGLTRLP